MATLKQLREGAALDEDVKAAARHRLIGLTAAGLLTVGGIAHDLHSGAEDKYHEHMKKTYGVERNDTMLDAMKKIVHGPRQQK